MSRHTTMRDVSCGLLLLVAVTGLHAQRAVRLVGTSFKLLHVSDAHIHPTDDSCRDVAANMRGFPCNSTNTTKFVRSVAHLEQPDLVAYTGDTIDSDASQAPKQAMDALYGVAVDAGVPWAASLGNHEDEVTTMTRDEIYDYIVKMPGADMSLHGPVKDSPGNFYVDLLAPAAPDVVVARLVFFDSRDDGVELSISEAQLAWFTNITATLPSSPTLAFYHIPLPDYQIAVDAGIPISGHLNEVISANKPNPLAFETLREGRVVAGFCGHDHTNDFCALWRGVQLCYEGSPGFQAYADCDPLKGCWRRRSRVTQLELSPDGRSLARVRSWKRVDGGGALAGPAVDEEILWSANSSVDSTNGGVGMRRVNVDRGRTLPRKKQLTLSAAPLA